LKAIDEMSEGLIISHIDDKNLKEGVGVAKFIIVGENKE